MKRIILLIFMSMLMTGSAFAECLFTIDDFTVTPDQVGTEIELCVKAEFSARVSAWDVYFTYPEGLTPTSVDIGPDMIISYINQTGNTRKHTPYFGNNDNYTRFMAITSQAGYWYDPAAGGYTSYGVVKWEGGTYEEMFFLYVEVSDNFHGGEIIIETECASDYDARGGTILENGDNGVSFTSVCNVTFEEPIVEPEAYACYTPLNRTLTFYYDNLRNSRTNCSTYDLNTGYNRPGWRTDGMYEYVKKVVFDPSFDSARPTSTYYWCGEMRSLESITGLNYLNTSEVTEMRYMFYDCSKLSSLDVTHFNTAKAINMGSMFSGCSKLTSLDVSNFNTAQATDIRSMFSGSTALTSLDLSSFNTAQVKNMSYMFYGCSNLQTIYVGDQWSTASVTSSGNMFYNCTSLVGGQGTTWNANHIDAAYAHIDGGPSNPGYFTDKDASQRGDVNGDGNVTISDVTALIDLLLGGGIINNPAADCNGDSNVTISDVTALIDYLLGGTW